MKRVGLLIIFLIFAILPCNAKSAQDKQMQDNSLPKIFVYHIPEDNENSSEIKTQTFASKIQNDDENLQVIAPEESDIVSDDVTADTSGEEEDLSEDNENDENYEITDMYSDVLQGYAEYNEDEDNTITLDNSNTDSKVNKVKIKKPEKFTKNDYSNLTVHRKRVIISAILPPNTAFRLGQIQNTNSLEISKQVFCMVKKFFMQNLNNHQVSFQVMILQRNFLSAQLMSKQSIQQIMTITTISICHHH